MDDRPVRIWVGEVELGRPLVAVPIVPGADDASERARVLARLHGEPLGFLDLPMDRGWNTPDNIAAAVDDQLAREVREHLAHDGVDDSRIPAGGVAAPCRTRAAEWHEPISVIVCTRDRPEQLAQCLPRLQRLAYDRFDVLVVDNASRDGATTAVFDRVVGADERFRLVREPRPGLSHARNRALAEARHDHVAFTDDDVLVDPAWLDGLARGFGRSAGVACVTGLVGSGRLDGSVEQYFDSRVSWSSSFRPEVFDIASPPGDDPLFPFAAGRFGTGANFAVERRAMRELGGFDAALGVGSPAGAGEDMDAFVRVLRSGRELAYEPSALVWHVHRSDLDDLYSQLFNYGRGLSAFLTKHMTDPDSRRRMLANAPGGARHALSLLRRGDAPATRRRLVVAEIAGMLSGPYAYAKGRWSLRRRERAHEA